MIRSTLAVLLVALTAATSLRAEQGGCHERTIPVSITSNDGSPAPELTAANLEGTYDGKPVIVRSAELEKTPPRVIFLVDTSGSMAQNGALAAEVAEDVLSQLPDNVEAGLAIFSDDLRPVVYATKDHVKLVDQLDALHRLSHFDKGRTALWTAVRNSAEMFGSPRVGDSIYLISDGGENKSHTTAPAVGGVLAGFGVRLFSFILEDLGIHSRSLEELNGPDVVRGAVRLTGGSAFFVPIPDSAYPHRIDLVDKSGRPTQIALGIQRQVQQMLGFYRVGIGLPQSVEKPKNWKLDFSASDKFQRNRFELSYPTLLTPCR